MSKTDSGHFNGTNGTKSQLIQELKDNDIKFSEKDIQFITKDKTGQIVWLETGNSFSGLTHIVSRHADDFLNKHGVTQSELSSHLNNVFTSGDVEYSRTTNRGGRTGYERLYNYNGNYYLLTGIGTNGYIVSAYPLNESDATKLIRRHKK